MKIVEFDIVFLSYDEPNADLHYADLCAKAPWAKRVHGVKGSDHAHKAAAELAETDWFITVDADNIVDPSFFNLDLDMSDPKIEVYGWCGRNKINGIRYVYEIGFTSTKILYENLKFYPKSQPATLIERKYGEPIKYGEYLTGRKKDIEEKLYENQLFLSKVSTDKLEGLTAAYLFFSEGIYVSTFHAPCRFSVIPARHTTLFG
jgi:hypothetical protein